MKEYPNDLILIEGDSLHDAFETRAKGALNLIDFLEKVIFKVVDEEPAPFTSPFIRHRYISFI